jgi:hypothetical protein
MALALALALMTRATTRLGLVRAKLRGMGLCTVSRMTRKLTRMKSGPGMGMRVGMGVEMEDMSMRKWMRMGIVLEDFREMKKRTRTRMRSRLATMLEVT